MKTLGGSLNFQVFRILINNLNQLNLNYIYINKEKLNIKHDIDIYTCNTIDIFFS